MAQVHWPAELLILENAQHPHYHGTGALFPAADSLAEYSSIHCVNCGCEGKTLFWCLGHSLSLIVIISSMSLNSELCFSFQCDSLCCFGVFPCCWHLNLLKSLFVFFPVCCLHEKGTTAFQTCTVTETLLKQKTKLSFWAKGWKAEKTYNKFTSSNQLIYTLQIYCRLIKVWC